MQTSRQEVRWALSSDAVKLLLILTVFNFALPFLLEHLWALDFISSYTVGRLILQGQGHTLFDVAAQAAYQRSAFGMHGALPFNHLAYEALLYVPLAMLPFRAALWIWRLISIALILLSSRLLADVYSCNRTHAVVLAFGFFPVPYAIALGQDSALLLLLIVLSLALLNRNRPQTAGFVLALALFKPHLILPIAAFLVWKRGLGFLRGFLGGTVLVLLLSTAVTGVRGWQQMANLWISGASRAGHAMGIYANRMPNLRGLLAALGLHDAVTLAALCALSILLVAIAAWALNAEDSPNHLYPALVVLTLLISFHLNVQDLSMLMIPILAIFRLSTKTASILASSCFFIALFATFGHIAMYSVVLLCVLWFSLAQAGASRRVSAT